MVISQNAMGKRILIADDSVTIQKAFVMTLGAEDFALTAARSADEGLTLARQTRPDLVIADASMPGRSGYELCAALKADAGLRGIPVYILSSTQQPYDEARGQQVGADGNLVKPWDSIVLIEKVKDASGHPAGAARPAPPAMTASRPASTLPAAALDRDYEVDMDAPRDTARTRETAIPAVRPAAPAAAPAGGMRPSLIPGMRPGAMPPARPGTSPSRTLGATMPMGLAVPPRPVASAAPMGRTLFGLPAASMPFPGSMRPAPVSAAPAAAPIAHAPAYTPTPAHAPIRAYAPEPIAARPAASLALSSAVGSLVDQKVAALAAKGPEYEALAKLSREVIEQIVWEIVPELAEVIIREHLAKRGTV
jgi:CheY-like chemotaxis protein